MNPVGLQPVFILSIKNSSLGLPWWRSGWESACRCRGHGFEPWSRKIPHATEQLGPWATTTEPARLEPVLRNKRGRNSERPTHRDEEWPPLAMTGESPRTETKTQHNQKLKTKQQQKNSSLEIKLHQTSSAPRSWSKQTQTLSLKKDNFILGLKLFLQISFQVQWLAYKDNQTYEEIRYHAQEPVEKANNRNQPTKTSDFGLIRDRL